ncbi:hypothetical protein TIFTF001_008594 [Ficus carica]|uniref:Uncharacterized protein n=1 Tax=Ficus carica TaxID=3494 RepID=A0AA88AFB7_FICCA|nr:hypothetical protein TIFTF001_008594 [Ficus carica]
MIVHFQILTEKVDVRLPVVGKALVCERAMKMTLAASWDSIVLEFGSTTIMSPLSFSSSPVLLLCSLICSPSLSGPIIFPHASYFPPPCLRVHLTTVGAGDLPTGLPIPRLLQYLSNTDVFSSVEARISTNLVGGVAKDGTTVMAAE